MVLKFYFDCAAFVLLFIVTMYRMRINKQKNIKNQLFLILLSTSLCGSALTIIGEVLDYYKNMPMLSSILDTVILVVLIFIPPLYGLCILSLYEMFYEVRKYAYHATFMLIPLGISVIAMLYSFFSVVILGRTPIAGTDIDVIKMFLLDFSAAFYAVAELIIMYKNRKVVGIKSTILMGAPVVFVAASMTLYIFFPTKHSILFVVAMCFLALVLFNKYSEGTVDTNTGFKTTIAFGENMSVIKAAGRECYVVIIEILNYNATLQSAGYSLVERATKGISESIRELLGKSKIIEYECYYDEGGIFYIVISNNDYEKVLKFSEDIVKLFLDNPDINEADYTLMANVCLASFPKDVEDIDMLMMLSEDLRNTPHALRVFFANELVNENDFEIRTSMGIIIDRAMKNGYFSVYYQPIYNIKKERFVSAEALIRLNDPEHGFISPSIFVPLAEKSGFIHKIGSFVLEEVCKFIASDEFKELGVEYIEVNLSAAQCLRVDLIDEVLKLTKKYGVSSSQLNLEITETAACYSQNRLLSNIRTLHNHGYTFSLDDFGTGYSNLMRMASLPLDIIKLDRAFVLMDEDSKFHVIIKNMVSLFKKMGLKTLVEGIETEYMVERFKDIEVDYIQGYYFSKPLPASEFVSFIRRYNLTCNTGKNI